MKSENIWRSIIVIAAALSVFAIIMVGTASATSLYVIKTISNSQMSAYDIQAAPNYLTHQLDTPTTGHYETVGLGIDKNSETLFVTYEGYTTIDTFDAKTLTYENTVTVPGASNLAGLVVDEGNQKIYTMSRNTNDLFVYKWDAVTQTLTQVGSKIDLSGVSQAYGIALDESKGLLYVGDLTTSVKIFKISDWSTAGTITVSQRAMGVAVDEANGYVYTGNAYPSYGSLGLLSKYDLNSHTESTVNIRSLSGGLISDNVLGLAVDQSTGLLYITTGNQAYGGSDRIIVFNSNLNMLHATGDIGDPTGIAVTKGIQVNLLNLIKDDGLADDECVSAGGSITYNICYDNMANTFPVNNVIISDPIPAQTSFVSATGIGTYDLSTNTFTWDIGTLSAGAQQQCVQLEVDVESTATPGSTIINSAKIDSDETPPTTVEEDTLVCLNNPPVIISLTTTPIEPVALGTSISLDSTWTDDAGDTFTLDIEWGDSTTDTKDVGDQTSDSTDYTYAEPGVYLITLTVTDNGGLSDTETTADYVVVYDPTAGFVSGCGWIDSPEGAMPDNPTATGMANFGFVSKYHNGAKVPEGTTQFHFNTGGLKFNSENYEWLVIADNKAKYKGTGTVYVNDILLGDNNDFILTGIDGEFEGGTEPDEFRIKIWDRVTEKTIYDNKLGEDDMGYEATELGEGNILIHIPIKNKVAS